MASDRLSHPLLPDGKVIKYSEKDLEEAKRFSVELMGSLLEKLEPQDRMNIVNFANQSGHSDYLPVKFRVQS